MYAIVGGIGSGIRDVQDVLSKTNNHVNLTSLVSTESIPCEITICNMIKPIMSEEDWVEKIKENKNRKFVTGITTLTEMIALKSLGYTVVYLDISWNERLNNIVENPGKITSVNALAIWSNATLKTELFDNLHPDISLKSSKEIADFLSKHV